MCKDGLDSSFAFGNWHRSRFVNPSELAGNLVGHWWERPTPANPHTTMKYNICVFLVLPSSIDHMLCLQRCVLLVGLLWNISKNMFGNQTSPHLVMVIGRRLFCWFLNWVHDRSSSNLFIVECGVGDGLCKMENSAFLKHASFVVLSTQSPHP